MDVLVQLVEADGEIHVNEMLFVQHLVDDLKLDRAASPNPTPSGATISPPPSRTPPPSTPLLRRLRRKRNEQQSLVIAC